MSDGKRQSFLLTAGLVRHKGESEREFALRRHDAVQRHISKMSDDERIQFALAEGGLVRKDSESEADFIRLSHEFVQRLGSPLSLKQWEQNIRVFAEAAL